MRSVSLASIMTLALLTSAIGQASNPPKEVAPIKFYCPVVGLPGVKSPCGCPSGYCSLKPTEGQAIDYKGAKLRFCCGQCVKIFKEAPDKFAVPANHQLVATKQAKQVKCPNCGGELGYVAAIDVAGIPVRFCSECWQTANVAKAENRINMVFSEKAFARGFVVTVEKK